MPFQPGEVANPNGARRPRRWADALERALAHKYETVGNGLLALAKVVVERASEGDKDALREIQERMDGKTTQMLGSDAEAPLTLVISPQDAKL